MNTRRISLMKFHLIALIALYSIASTSICMQEIEIQMPSAERFRELCPGDGSYKGCGISGSLFPLDDPFWKITHEIFAQTAGKKLKLSEIISIAEPKIRTNLVGRLEYIFLRRHIYQILLIDYPGLAADKLHSTISYMFEYVKVPNTCTLFRLFTHKLILEDDTQPIWKILPHLIDRIENRILEVSQLADIVEPEMQRFYPIENSKNLGLTSHSMKIRQVLYDILLRNSPHAAGELRSCIYNMYEQKNAEENSEESPE